jgi:hypothetical protein
MEKVDEHYFLFGIQGGTDAHHPGVRTARVERDLLDPLNGLKDAGRPLRTRDSLGEHLQVSRKVFRFNDGFSVLATFDVAFVGVLE